MSSSVLFIEDSDVADKRVYFLLIYIFYQLSDMLLPIIYVVVIVISIIDCCASCIYDYILVFSKLCSNKLLKMLMVIEK